MSPPAAYGPRRYGSFAFRLGAARGETWATGTIQFHRPLPDHARVAAARLVRERVGNDFRYALQLTVTLGNAVTIAVPAERKPLVAVHLGWAADESGRRIAGVADCPDAGVVTVVQFPPNIEENLKRANEIQGVRDVARNQIVAAIKALDLDKFALPEAHMEEILAIRRLPLPYVSQQRLHR